LEEACRARRHAVVRRVGKERLTCKKCQGFELLELLITAV